MAKIRPLKLSGCTSTLNAKYCLDNLTTKYKAIMTFLRLWIQKVPVLVFKWFVLDCPTLGWFHFIAWFNEIWDHRVMEKCCSLPEEGIHVPSRRIFEKDLIIIVNFRWAVMLHHAKIRIKSSYFHEKHIFPKVPFNFQKLVNNTWFPVNLKYIILIQSNDVESSLC